LVNGEALMISMKTIAVSSGSACTSANPEPSHVLRAIGLSEDLTRASLRFGLGRFNTTEEVEYAAAAVAENVHRLRQLSSLAKY
jgi:cysteine desulfurase